MKNLSEHIDISIKEELALINSKINGLSLLEILKYRIIDRLREFVPSISINSLENSKTETNFEDETRKINIKLQSFNSSSFDLNSKINYDMLFICINQFTNISVEDFESKKNFIFKCIPMTGIVISKGLNCTRDYKKNSIVLELSLEDKTNDIEKLPENTIYTQ